MPTRCRFQNAPNSTGPSLLRLGGRRSEATRRYILVDILLFFLDLSDAFFALFLNILLFALKVFNGFFFLISNVLTFLFECSLAASAKSQ
jgi:hypothetical protein